MDCLSGLYKETPTGRVEPRHQGFVFGLCQETDVKAFAGSADIGREGLGEEVVIVGGGGSVGHGSCFGKITTSWQ